MRQYKSLEEAEAAGVHISKVKSYVKREGRLTNGQARALEKLWPTMGVDYCAERVDFNAIFEREAPLVIEIGFGMGKSLVEMASASPDTNFLGIEVHKPGVGSCLSDAEDADVSNLRVMEHDAVDVLNNMVVPSSVSRVQLYFPDPWHKKRHHKRRIVQPEFVASVRECLSIGGTFHMATDWEHYAHHMVENMNDAAGFKNIAENGNFVARPAYRPITKFEKRGQKLGHGVWDIIYKRVS